MTSATRPSNWASWGAAEREVWLERREVRARAQAAFGRLSNSLTPWQMALLMEIDALHGEDLTQSAALIRERLRRRYPELSDALDVLTGNPAFGVSPYETFGPREQDEAE